MHSDISACYAHEDGETGADSEELKSGASRTDLALGGGLDPLDDITYSPAS